MHVSSSSYEGRVHIRHSKKASAIISVHVLCSVYMVSIHTCTMQATQHISRILSLHGKYSQVLYASYNAHECDA